MVPLPISLKANRDDKASQYFNLFEFLASREANSAFLTPHSALQITHCFVDIQASLFDIFCKTKFDIFSVTEFDMI